MNIDEQRALVLLGEYGTGEETQAKLPASYPEKGGPPFPGYSIADHYPDWLIHDVDMAQANVTSLVSVPLFGYGPDISTLDEYLVSICPAGWEPIHWHQAGETECPECGDSYTCDDTPKPEVCFLCLTERAETYGRVIYDGEEAHVVVWQSIEETS